MKTTIKIEGQISGNFKLRSAISNHKSTEEKGMFNSIYLHFSTKKDAYKALSEGRKWLKSEGEDFSYSPKYFLSYDASTAKIIED